MIETQSKVEANAMKGRACKSCLSRARLLERLGPFIENAVGNPHRYDLRRLLSLDDTALVMAVAPQQTTDLVAESRDFDLETFEDEIRGADLWAICRHDSLYPSQLNDLGDPPAVLFGRGDPALLINLDKETSVAVIGSRRASSYGLEVARSLSHELTSAGQMVVSGMALGIDGAAHRGALETGSTVAVLGCGADRAYPVSHTRLYRKIVETGLVLSEQVPGARAWKWTFPARNRIIAALSGATIVVEAATRSGSLMTAQYAEDLDRTVGAVPGMVTSGNASGTNELIAEGAQLIRDGADALAAKE